MYRKKAPRLAAAFVVTISAGCGASGSGSHGPPTQNPPEEVPPDNFIRLQDGTCVIQHPANPPWNEPVDCETRQPLKPQETPQPEPTASVDPIPEPPPKPSKENLPTAPSSWTIKHNSDGSCIAYPPSAKCPPTATCNPPPPRRVKCSSDR